MPLAQREYDPNVWGPLYLGEQGFGSGGSGVLRNVSDMSYFNAGSILTGIKSITQVGLEGLGAAATVYGAYKSFGHPAQTAAAGPTAQHPVLAQAPQSIPGEVSHAIMHPIQTALSEMGLTHARGRYATPGTKGYHMIRRGPHAGLWTKNRHRNVCNPRALRRAISRAHGFARLAMKTIHLVHPKQKGRFGGFRKRRKSR